MKGTRGS